MHLESRQLEAHLSMSGFTADILLYLSCKLWQRTLSDVKPFHKLINTSFKMIA